MRSLSTLVSVLSTPKPPHRLYQQKMIYVFYSPHYTSTDMAASILGGRERNLVMGTYAVTLTYHFATCGLAPLSNLDAGALALQNPSMITVLFAPFCTYIQNVCDDNPSLLLFRFHSRVVCHPGLDFSFCKKILFRRINYYYNAVTFTRIIFIDSFLQVCCSD